MTELNLIGATLGRFEILDLLGRGGMAVVYRARQTDLDRIVALKVLPSALTHDASYVARFRQEARSVARLEHPHIMPIYEVGEANGLHFIAMKYIQGRTVKELLQESGPLSVTRAAQILAQVGDALDYAHRQGIIHRDIKPSNMMITNEGWVFLTDFGLARGAGADPGAGLTLAGTVMGTPEYMSPEQAQGLPNVGPPTDIYALGVVLYELLTGAFPFVGETPMAMLAARLMHAPTPPRDVRADLPSAVEDVVMRALARKPEARFASAADMVAALRAAAGIGTVEPPRPATPRDGLPAMGATLKVPAPPLAPTPTPYVRPDAAFGANQPYPAAQASPPVPGPAGWAPPADHPTQPPPVAPPARSRSRNLPIILGALAVALLSCVGLLVAAFVFDGSSPTNPPTGPTVVGDSRMDADLAAADAALSNPDAGLAEAYRAYQLAEAQFPDQPAVIARLAMATAARGDWPMAESFADRLINTPASDAHQVALGHALLAESLAAQGDYRSALPEAEYAVASDPELAFGQAVWANLLARNALAAISEADMERALDRLDQAVDRLADEPPLLRALTHNALGATFASQYRLSDDEAYFEESATQYEAAIDLVGSAGRFRIGLAELYAYADDPAQAQALYREAETLDPDTGAQALTGVGWIYYAADDSEAAEAAFAAALAANPTWYDSYYGQARLRFDAKDYDGALSLLDQALERNPYYSPALGWRGESYFWKGYHAEGDQAVDYFERSAAAFSEALARDDFNSFAALGLGWTLQYLERYDESVAAFDQALVLAASNDEAHNGRGWSLFNLGRYDEAEAAIRAAIELNPSSVYAYINLGRTLEQQAQRGEARAAYEQALELDPENELARRYLDDLGP